jgi:molybdopterin biosynthesis enzyme
LAAKLISPIDVPALDNSTMDGFDFDDRVRGSWPPCGNPK